MFLRAHPAQHPARVPQGPAPPRAQPALPQLTASCCSDSGAGQGRCCCESGAGQGRFYPELSALCLASGLCHSLHFVCVTVFILSASQSSFCLCHSPHFVCVTVLILSVSQSSFCLCHSPHFVCVSLHLVCATVFILSVSQSSSCLCHCLHLVCVTVLILSVLQSSSCPCHNLYLLCVSLNLVCVRVFILFLSVFNLSVRLFHSLSLSDAATLVWTARAEK